MNFEEALKEIGKHEPCPHDAVQTDLGNGKVWARCEDCGQTIQQSSLPALRRENERFRKALSVISSMYHDTDQAKIEQAIHLLNQALDTRLLLVPTLNTGEQHEA